MKYHHELSSLESAIIRLDSFAALLDICTTGSEHTDREKLTNVMYVLTEMLDDINHNIRTKFDEVWEADKNYAEPSVELTEIDSNDITITSSMALDEVYDTIDAFERSR
jgi:hypothetical protein